MSVFVIYRRTVANVVRKETVAVKTWQEINLFRSIIFKKVIKIYLFFKSYFIYLRA